MSERDWADEILAGSSLPDDDFTFTEGSNYGLDGFDFDVPDDEGVLDGARLPEVKGLAQLPDGFTGTYRRTAEDDISLVDEVDGLNLGEWIDETAVEKTASLADLNWLDPTQPQDPERLPSEPFHQIPELEEAWGVDRRTDGLSLVPNKDKEVVEYEDSLKEPLVSGLPEGEETERVKSAIKWAFRRAADGLSPEEIKKGLVTRLGHSARFTRRTVHQIEADYGLAGNVFVYSAVYPGIHKAAYREKIKAHLRKKSARYVVVPEGEKRLSVWEEIGLKPVTKVPWKAAFAHYSPKLQARGYRVASDTLPRRALKRAFLAGPQESKHVPSTKPRDIRPAERVGVQEALHKFRTAEAVPVQALDNTNRIEEAQRKKVLARVAKWVKAGYMSLEDAHRLARSSVAPGMILRTATMLVQASTAGSSTSYEGVGTKYKTKVARVSREAAWGQLRAAEAETNRKARELEESRRATLGEKLNPMVAKGLLTREEANKLASLDKPVDEILKLAAAAAQYKRPVKLPKTEEREYEGALVEAALIQEPKLKDFDPEEKRILSAAKRSGIKAREFRSLLKWARIQMSEGSAGEELDDMLRYRFSPTLLKAAKKLLKAARKQHEGLSGFLYVDAGAYASKTGLKGCERGARYHRADGLKTVLSVDKCAGCVRKNADGFCTAYNKLLVDEPPVDDPAGYQRKAIKASNASDAEITASLFAPAYDEGEFNLVDPLQEISYDESTSPEELGEILFGGMEL